MKYVHVALLYGVADIEARGLEMKALGEGRHRIVWILDPAGNTMELQQDPDC